MQNRIREYRVWDTKRKQMYYEENIDSDYYISVMGKLYSFEYCHPDGIERYEDKDLILLEWTGLLDKNGVKIYEGDVVRDQEYAAANPKFSPNLVEWDETECGFYPFGTHYPYFEPESIEVIGNIWENPTILSQAQ